eukprot:TRINITY_DN17100_c0_g1_i1.p1 TRINITY_DN17100_c0_g1~~TRINITY_DN17100_c0_g1_i1.p1  ORF type:complete len:441 (-),score=102.37 TRINITY_DN17100_c0_g1_i1:27-1349(-)
MEPSEDTFVHDIRLEDMRKAIQGRVDFRECKYADHSIFVYFLGMAEDIFPDPNTAPDPETKLYWKLRRECRGSVFSTETGKVISRRFHKFFNVNETEETKAEKIRLDRHFIVLEKLDGSMIAPYYTGGKLRFATKNGLTDTAASVEDWANQSPIPYREFCTKWVDRGWTPIFEYINSNVPIVLQYGGSSFSLIAIRNMSTGEYLPFEEMQKEAAEMSIPVVKMWSSQELGIDLKAISTGGFKTFYEAIQKQTGLEGFVIRFDDGTMLKIKTHWYFGLSKSLDLVRRGSHRKRWEAVLTEKYDDLRSHLSGVERDAMDRFSKEMLHRLYVKAEAMVQACLIDHASKSRREFAASKNIMEPKPIMFKIWDLLDERKITSPTCSDDLIKELTAMVTPMMTANLMLLLNSPQKFDAMSDILTDGLKWSDYAPPPDAVPRHADDE